MNGIQFIVRDQSGWAPQIAPPRSRFTLKDPAPKPLSRREVAFIRASQGALPSNDLAECFGVSTQTIRDIWKRRTHTGKRPGRKPKKKTTRRKPRPTPSIRPQVTA
ncbi:helix-turn-helix domain-containing protein [Achromobacter xylosoxidans]|uniref:helix-turn-helix domain-containing protein n=1 Tax=Alcaligenes xylosoxydans xylosoxydans TaxID=85698 RepID=UPI001F136407|nr:helix-turn-helix domain-containing protein [Achromobacter xylosoxidans]